MLLLKLLLKSVEFDDDVKMQMILIVTFLEIIMFVKS